jgi:hypothetical protein
MAARKQSPKSRDVLIAISLLAGGCETAIDGTQNGSASRPELSASGTVEIDEDQVNLLANDKSGGGRLRYQGRVYPFSIGGLGINGLGYSHVKATGTVYNLTNIHEFEGIYGRARWGYALVGTSAGKLWLEKAGSDIVIKLEAKRDDLAVSLGGDAVDISLN